MLRGERRSSVSQLDYPRKEREQALCSNTHEDLHSSANRGSRGVLWERKSQPRAKASGGCSEKWMDEVGQTRKCGMWHRQVGLVKFEEMEW